MTDPGHAGAGRPVEVELKFRMTGTGAGERLLAAEDVAGFTALGPAVSVVQEDRYLDTPQGALAAAGYAGRLRMTKRGTVITLKGLRRADQGGALHRREELEGPADAATPPDAWPASPARAVVLEVAGDVPLVELVTIRQTRRKRDYERDGSVVELSVDDVAVVTDGRVIERFAELEIELRKGEEAALEPLADLLSEIEELIPAETSKLERALEAVRREAAPDADRGIADGGTRTAGSRIATPTARRTTGCRRPRRRSCRGSPHLARPGRRPPRPRP